MRVWLFSVLLAGSLHAKTHIVTMDEVITMALKHSPDIDSSRLDFAQALQRTKAARSFYLPQLDLSASGGKQWHTLASQSHQNIDILTGSLGASQLLYDFGKTAGNIGRTEEEALAYEAQMHQRIADKIYTMKKLYYAILTSRSIIAVQQKNVTLQKQQLHRAKKYLLAGIKTIIDVSDAEVKLEQAVLDLENANYDLALKRAELEEAMGYLPYQGNYRLYGEKLSYSNLSKQLPKVKTPLGKLEAYAYLHRYVMVRSKHSVQSAQSTIRSKQGDYLPTLSVGAHYTLQHVDETMALSMPKNEGQVMVTMQWNLFSGHKSEAEVEEAKIAAMKAASQLHVVELAIKKEVIASHIELRRSKKGVELSESISRATLKKFKQAQKRYENDLSDYIELQEAQQSYIQSLSRLVSAYYAYFVSLAQLDHAIGK